jgi:hypothetical protein
MNTDYTDTEKLISFFHVLAAILAQGFSTCRLVQDFIGKSGLTDEEQKLLAEAVNHCGGTVECLCRIFNALTKENLPRILEGIDFNRPSISDSQNLEKLCVIVGVDKPQKKL